MPDPIIGGAAIATVGTIGGALIGGSSAEKAAEAQAGAAGTASATELEMYYQSREDLEPYRRAAEYAMYGTYGPPPAGIPSGAEGGLIGLMAAGPGEFTEDPGYQFRLQEGIKALERSAAARGGQLSGAQGKALQRYGQEYASGEYQNWLNRYYRSMDPYFQLAQLGAGPGMASAQQAIGVGQSLGQNALLAGQANAANYLTQGQIWSDVLGGLGSNALYSMYQANPYSQGMAGSFGFQQPYGLSQPQMYSQTGAPSMYYGLLD